MREDIKQQKLPLYDHGGAVHGVPHLAIGGSGPRNWSKGKVEENLRSLKTSEENPEAYKVAAENPKIGPVTRHEMQQAYIMALHGQAINQWIGRNLTNYIRKQMATHDDPIRKLAEQGIHHMEESPEPSVSPEEAESHRREYQGEKLAQSPLAQQWEDLSDMSVSHRPIGFIRGKAAESEGRCTVIGPLSGRFNTEKEAQEFIQRVQGLAKEPGQERLASQIAEEPFTIVPIRPSGWREMVEPWMEKADQNTPIHIPSNYMHMLGFDHIVDVLKQDLAEGRIRPEQLSKVSIEQAVRRTHEYNEERKKAMAETALKATEGMPVHKDYGNGFRWLELTMPEVKEEEVPKHMSIEQTQGQNEWAIRDNNTNRYVTTGLQSPEHAAQHMKHIVGEKKLADALRYEGDTMGHCVGGYCPDVVEGRSRIFSLRDAKNEPHVTIEVEPDPRIGFREGEGPVGTREDFNLRGQYAHDVKSERVPDTMTFAEWWRAKNGIPEPERGHRITQIKGKSNAKPKKSYIPYVQDFVKSGNWSEIGDFRNTELRDVQKTPKLHGWLKEKGIPHERYMTEQEYGKHESDFLADQPQLKARGGSIHGMGVALDFINHMSGGGTPPKKVVKARMVMPAAERAKNRERAFAESQIKDRVYHGTTKSFSEFKPGRIWFASKPDIPNEYAGPLAENHGMGGNLMPLYVNAKNPARFPATEEGWNEWAKNVRSDQALRAAGHDSVIFVDENGNFTTGYAFNPSQVKSAIGNEGTYDLTKRDITKASGGPVRMNGGGTPPKKVVKAYKLFRTREDRPGELFPLFVNADQSVPLRQWVDAEIGPQAESGKVKSKLGELAFRPGWHSGDVPVATHIGAKSKKGLTKPDTRPENQVWAEVSVPDDVDWQSEANKRGTNKQGRIVPVKAHITDQLPVGGHYRYKTNPNMAGNWLISGAMRVNRVLPDEEVAHINQKAGVADLPRRKPVDIKKKGFNGGGMAQAMDFLKTVMKHG
jgi:hypothetical protein